VGLGAVFHQGPEEGAKADQCQVGDGSELERYDPESGKTPFAVARVDGNPVAFAGIWEEWRASDGVTLQTFATMTTDANRKLAAIQDRMPGIIEQEDWVR
jgi:putative SOS response-associated peptidase YedK